MACPFRSCCDALFVASREVFVSPQGTNTIIIEHDHVCRPYIYQKTWYGKREIWTYLKGGFIETVSFGVEFRRILSRRVVFPAKSIVDS